MSEKYIEDYWNVDGDREWSDTWTGFTRFTVLDEKPPEGYTWSGERLTRKQTTSRLDTLWPEIWKDMCRRVETQRKAEVGNRGTKARQFQKIRWYFLCRTWWWGNSRISWKMLVENWKFRCQPQCLANFNLISTGIPVAQLKNTRQNMLVLLRPTNLPESVWKDLFASIMKTILQGKEWTHWTIAILCTSSFLCLKPWKYQKQRQQWRKNGKNEENTSMAADECQEQKRGDRWSKEWAQNRTVHFASLMDLCHLKNSELEPPFQKYKGRVVLRGDIVKNDSGSFAVFTEQGSSAAQMTAARVMDVISRLAGCSGQAADAVSAYTQVKLEDAPSLLKIPKSECPDIWLRLPKHKWPKSRSSMEDPVVPLERNLYCHPLARLLWERQFEKVLLENGWEKFQIGNADSLRERERKEYSCLCTWTISKWQERNKIWSDLENIHERRWCGRTNIIP